MPSETEFVNYKDFVESLDSVNPSANDKAVLNVGGLGPKSSVFSAIAAFVHNAWAAFVNALTSKTSFANGDKIPVVNGSTATAMEASKLLELTAQNALAGNVAIEFVPNSTTTIAGLPYIYDGKLYVAKEAYQGPWDASKFAAINVFDLLNLSKGEVTYAMTASAPFDTTKTFPINSCYIVTNDAALERLQDKPENGQFALYTFGPTVGDASGVVKMQIAFCASGSIYFRRGWTSPSTWVKLQSEAAIRNMILDEAKLFRSAGEVTYAMTASAPFDTVKTFPINRCYIVANGAALERLQDKPTDGQFSVFTFGAVEGSSTTRMQIAYGSSGKMYFRRGWPNLGNWVSYQTESDVNSLILNEAKLFRSAGEVTYAMTASAPFDTVKTFPINRCYIVANGAALERLQDKPTDGQFSVFTFGAVEGSSTTRMQVAFCADGAIYYRRGWPSLGNWIKLKTDTDIRNLASEVVVPAYKNINLLAVFNDIRFVGDSLTESVVYTSELTFRNAFVGYPMSVKKITGTEQIGIYAHGGDTAITNWTREKDNYDVDGTCPLAIIFLGTNGGLTDTIDTDAPVNADPSTWADTNTGCYCKIVDKFISLGAKILLLKPFGGGGSSLETTKLVVEKIAARFGCSVMQAPRDGSDKYHCYPDLSGTNWLHFNDLGYSWFASALISDLTNLDNDNLKHIVP